MHAFPCSAMVSSCTSLSFPLCAVMRNGDVTLKCIIIRPPHTMPNATTSTPNSTHLTWPSSSHSCTARVAIGEGHNPFHRAGCNASTSRPSAAHLWLVQTLEWPARRTDCTLVQIGMPGAVWAISNPCRNRLRQSSRPSFVPLSSGPCILDRRHVARVSRSCHPIANLRVHPNFAMQMRRLRWTWYLSRLLACRCSMTHENQRKHCLMTRKQTTCEILPVSLQSRIVTEIAEWQENSELILLSSCNWLGSS